MIGLHNHVHIDAVPLPRMEDGQSLWESSSGRIELCTMRYRGAL